MQLLLDDRQEALFSKARALGEGLPPDDDPGLAPAALDALRAAGLALLTVPTDRGGAGLTLFDACLVLEGLARTRPSAAATLASHAILAGATLAGTEHQDGAVADLASDRAGAFARSEPAITAQVKAGPTDGDGAFLLSGEARYVTNGGAWALVLVAARVEGEEGPGLFLVDGDEAGVEWRPRSCAVGLLGARVADLVLHDVPARARLGGVGEGGAQIEEATLRDRAATAAQAVGVAAEALDLTLRAASTRELDGKPMQRSGTVQAQVADMAAALDGARLLWWQAACALDRGEPARGLTSMAKLHAARAGRLVTDGCLQLMGEGACFEGTAAARRVGDARMASIRGGTDEAMRAIAATEFLARLEVAGMIT